MTILTPFAHRLDRFAFLIALWLAALVLVSLLSPYFLQASTVPYLLQYIPILGLLGIGQTLVMLSGGPGIDLSVGSTLSLTGVFLGYSVGGLGMPVVPACLLTLLLGAGLGWLNGVLVNVIRIPSLMATLATYFAFGGLAIALTGGVPRSGFPAWFGWLGQPGILGIPNQFLFVFVPVAIAIHVVLAHTVLGRHIYACGNNEHAARLLGVRVDLIRTGLYTLSGLLASLAAVINSAWLMSASPSAGDGLELLAVTVTVLGGTHIFGGEGNIKGTVLAVFIVTTFQIGLELAGISMAWQLGLIGSLLIGSVGVTQLLQRTQPRAA